MRSGLQLVTRLPAASVLGSALWYDFEIVVAGHSNRTDWGAAHEAPIEHTKCPLTGPLADQDPSKRA